MKIVFMGTPDFAVKTLEKLVDSNYEVGLVLTQQDKAKDRGKKIQFTPVKEFALSHNIQVLQPERLKGNEETLDAIKEYNPDVIVVVAYGKLLPKEILELPRHGCVNVHASLLPKLRGASPIQHAIIGGYRETGVTIIKMSEGLDTGDMIIQRAIPIGDMNFSRLHDALAVLGADLCMEALKLLESGEASFSKQDDTLATYAGIIRKENGRIDFSDSPQQVELKVRGYDPWPGAFCYYSPSEESEKIMMKVWKAAPIEKDSLEPCGTILETDDEGIKVSCGGKILLISELQVPGKKRMAVKDYIKGNKIIKGRILE